MKLVQLNGFGCFELTSVDGSSQFISFNGSTLTVKFDDKDNPYVVKDGQKMIVTNF